MIAFSARDTAAVFTGVFTKRYLVHQQRLRRAALARNSRDSHPQVRSQVRAARAVRSRIVTRIIAKSRRVPAAWRDSNEGGKERGARKTRKRVLPSARTFVFAPRQPPTRPSLARQSDARSPPMRPRGSGPRVRVRARVRRACECRACLRAWRRRRRRCHASLVIYRADLFSRRRWNADKLAARVRRHSQMRTRDHARVSVFSPFHFILSLSLSPFIFPSPLLCLFSPP